MSDGDTGLPEALDKQEETVLPCSTAFVLMPKAERVSRNLRAQWYLQHLLTPVALRRLDHSHGLSKDLPSELCAVGAIPERDEMPEEWDWDVAHLYKYRLTPSTRMCFLTQRHRLVYLIDLSPSAADASSRLEAVVPALRHSLSALARPFNVPGSQLLLHPELFVSIVAWTPFLAPDMQLVLKQGVEVSARNVDAFLQGVVEKLHALEKQIVSLNRRVQAEVALARAQAERWMGGLFDVAASPAPKSRAVHVTTADSGFFAMIRMGLMSLQVLPKNASSNLIVLTDGCIAAHDAEATDRLLGQLRTEAIALSFIQISAPNIYSNDELINNSQDLEIDDISSRTGLARLDYPELLDFLARSTYGTYMRVAPKLEYEEEYIYDLNVYHKRAEDEDDEEGWDENHEASTIPESSIRHKKDRSLEAEVIGQDEDLQSETDLDEDVDFFNTELMNPGLQRKYHFELACGLQTILSCRLREGYHASRVRLLSEDLIEVALFLDWKVHSRLYYIVQSEWPLKKSKEGKCKIFIFLEGDYDLQHDLVCNRRTALTNNDTFSVERTAVVRKFAALLQHLAAVDKLLLHLESFSFNKDHYVLPETVSKGSPVFYLPQQHTHRYGQENQQGAVPELWQPDFPFSSFLSFWRPVSIMDISVWHKWMHTHSINMILTHDSPLAKHFVSPNFCGRFATVQCRKATAKLYSTLKEASHFVLVENSTYVKFLYDTGPHEENDMGYNGPAEATSLIGSRKGTGDFHAENKELASTEERPSDCKHPTPSSFLLMRITAKAPCVVLWLAFLAGTPGNVRQSEIEDLQARLKAMTIHQNKNKSGQDQSTEGSLSSEPACLITSKRVENLIVRYDDVPQELRNILRVKKKRKQNGQMHKN